MLGPQRHSSVYSGYGFSRHQQLNEFFLFFALGIIARAHYENYLRLLDKSLIFLGAAVVIAGGCSLRTICRLCLSAFSLFWSCTASPGFRPWKR